MLTLEQQLGRALFEDWSVQKGSFFTLDSGQVVELVDVQLFPNKEGRTSDLRPAAFVTTFEVRRGDTLSRIAARYGVPLRTLFEINGLTGRSILRPGQVIRIDP